MNDICGHILVVDDNRMNRLKLTRGLEHQGHTAASAEHGVQAMEMVRVQTFDLILLDILMPEMDGYQVLECLKQDKALRDIPVIVISALDEMESVVKCIEMGAEDYLPKPFDAVLLKARIGAALEKKRLRDREQLYSKNMERELEIGRQIQGSFFPDSVPDVPGWEIAVQFRAARQVSGDFYDTFPLAESGVICIVIADVCDKGVGAALFMGLIRSLIRSFTQICYEKDPKGWFDKADSGTEGADVPRDPFDDQDHMNTMEKISSFTNDYIATTHSSANMFATLFWGVIDTASGVLYYVNCGHENAVIVNGNGIKQLLEPTGPAIGLMPGMEFEAKKVELDTGDILFGYTDGITEARDAEGGFYGEDRLMGLISNRVSSAAELLESIESSLSTYTEGVDQSDDITMLAVRRLPV